MLVEIVGGLRRGRGLDSPHEPVHDQDATKARPERDLAFSGHFPQVSPERSGACAHRRIAWTCRHGCAANAQLELRRASAVSSKLIVRWSATRVRSHLLES